MHGVWLLARVILGIQFFFSINIKEALASYVYYSGHSPAFHIQPPSICCRVLVLQGTSCTLLDKLLDVILYSKKQAMIFVEQTSL